MTPEQKEILKYKKLLFEAGYSDWISNDLFTLRWWILLVFLTVPWLIWFILVDKRRFKEMFLYLLLTSEVAVLLDEIGATLTLWAYPVNLLPILPRLITVNYTMVPIIFTLVYQYFPSWKLFIIANIVLTLVFSFILEPILVWIKLYHLITWKYFYSIPVYLLAAILLKWLIERVKRIQRHAMNT